LNSGRENQPNYLEIPRGSRLWLPFFLEYATFAAADGKTTVARADRWVLSRFSPGASANTLCIS
jgi:hypothetical protein